VLWSALSYHQLMEQIWRFPQPKQVHIYHLIGRKSPDAFGSTYLNSIFGKEFQMLASEIDDKLSEWGIKNAGAWGEVG
jgi:hypothetical protein